MIPSGKENPIYQFTLGSGAKAAVHELLIQAMLGGGYHLLEAANKLEWDLVSSEIWNYSK